MGHLLLMVGFTSTLSFAMPADREGGREERNKGTKGEGNKEERRGRDECAHV